MGILDSHDNNRARLERGVRQDFDDSSASATLGRDGALESAGGDHRARSSRAREEGPKRAGSSRGWTTRLLPTSSATPICADRIHYIWRDHLNTGLPMALGKRFLSSFFITPEGDPEVPPPADGAQHRAGTSPAGANGISSERPNALSGQTPFRSC